MQPTSFDRQQADRLLARLLDLSPAARRAALDETCGDDAALHAAVERLLEAAEAPDSLLDSGSGWSDALWHGVVEELGSQRDQPHGTRIGPWRLLHELGRGGMGAVYLVERADGAYEQRAALKLIRAEADSEEILHRFEQERQILASLTHPGIARLLDGGRAEDGSPYLVMEHVEGRPIDRFCDEQRLTIEERLELFDQVGRAVQHAHRNLVVHRDLKPSNIFVTAEGEAKLLDFGIAKVLAPSGDLKDPVTRTVARVFTPGYASPEQVRGEPVTTASDVYQLGLLLYELLTGERAQTIEDSSPTAFERAVCEAEPARPSARVAAAAAVAAAVARRTTPPALRRKLRGDLDNIVLEALRKEPDRRYSGVAELVEDLGRWRRGLPVSARPETFGYRSGKLVRRHPFGAAAAVVVFLLLIAYAMTSTLQAAALARERDRAHAEAEKAQQVKTFVLRLFEGADPHQARGEEISARELLDRGWASIEGELIGQPEVQVELLETVGEIYRELGLYERAEPLLVQALELGRTLAPREPPLLAAVLRSNGRLRRDLGDYDAADELLHEALALYRERFGEAHPEIATTLSVLGWVANQRVDYETAVALFREALEIRRGLYGTEHRDVAQSLAEVGLAMRNQGDYMGAEPMLRQALELRRHLLPEGHPETADSLTSLAAVRMSLGQLGDAESLFGEALELMTQARGADHIYVASIMYNLARVLHIRGDLTSAESLYRQALDIRRRVLGEHHASVAMSLNHLAELLQDTGQLDAAESMYEEALSAYSPDHPWRWATVFNLARVLEARGDHRSAERLYRQALAEERAHYGDEHVRVAIDRRQLGVVLHLQGDHDAAERQLRRAVEILRKRLPRDHYQLSDVLLPLGTLLLDAGRAVEAEPVLREAAQIRRATFGEDDVRTVEAADAWARVLTPQFRETEVVPLR